MTEGTYGDQGGNPASTSADYVNVGVRLPIPGDTYSNAMIDSTFIMSGQNLPSTAYLFLSTDTLSGNRMRVNFRAGAFGYGNGEILIRITRATSTIDLSGTDVQFRRFGINNAFRSPTLSSATGDAPLTPVPKDIAVSVSPLT